MVLQTQQEQQTGVGMKPLRVFLHFFPRKQHNALTRSTHTVRSHHWTPN